MKRIAVFVSGGGTNLQALIDAFESGYIRGGKIELVFSDKKESQGLQRAYNHNIPSFCLSLKDFKSREEFDRAIAAGINREKIDLVCLAGYMMIFTKAFFETYKGKIMNIHPSLLPSFGGRGMYGIHVHEAVIDHGVKVTGATVHFVDEGTDTGPIIMQKCVH
ncbi:MAG: phosphoribosylglycinamide formyltransferase, partial [Spirochaetia bacterium]|nr:phosphoribosylglycinamide formyltransferase [Spirochaetia bacterium]